MENFDVFLNREFVQCLNVSNNHWITISTVSFVPGVVNVYNSLHLGLTTSLKKTVANLLHTNKAVVVVQHLHMQQQVSESDCGVLAITTATAICNGQKPEALRFDQCLMRQHLLKSIEDKLLLPFPSRKLAKKKLEIFLRERIRIYCIM